MSAKKKKGRGKKAHTCTHTIVYSPEQERVIQLSCVLFRQKIFWFCPFSLSGKRRLGHSFVLSMPLDSKTSTYSVQSGEEGAGQVKNSQVPRPDRHDWIQQGKWSGGAAWERSESPHEEPSCCHNTTTRHTPVTQLHQKHFCTRWVCMYRASSNNGLEASGRRVLLSCWVFPFT